MQDVVRAVAACVGVPLAGMSLGLWFARPGRGEPGPAPRRDWIPALAGLCIPGAWVIAQGWPSLPAARASDWLPWLALTGAVGGLVAAVLAGVVAGAAGSASSGAAGSGWRTGRAARAAVVLVALVKGGVLLLAIVWPLAQREETRVLAWAWMVASAASIVPAWGSLRRLGGEGGVFAPVLGALSLSVSSAVVLLTGSVAVAILMASLAALLGAGAGWGFAGRRSPRIGPMAAGLAIPLAGLWMYAGVIGDTPWWVALPAWMSTVLAGPSARAASGSRSTLARWAIRWAIVGVPAGVALAAALASQPEGTW